MTKHKDTYRDIIGPSGCLSREGMRRAVSGRLDPLEKHRVDKHLAGCELCREALEGMRQTSTSEAGLAALLADMDSKAPDWAKTTRQSTGGTMSTGAKIVKMPLAAKITSLVAVAASITLIIIITTADYGVDGRQEKYEDLAKDERKVLMPVEDGSQISMADEALNEEQAETAKTREKQEVVIDQDTDKGTQPTPKKADDKPMEPERKDEAPMEMSDEEVYETEEAEGTAPGTGGLAVEPAAPENQGLRTEEEMNIVADDQGAGTDETAEASGRNRQARKQKTEAEKTDDDDGFNLWGIFESDNSARKAEELPSSGKDMARKQAVPINVDDQEEPIYEFALMEEQPVFFLGNDSIRYWVEKRIQYPEKAKANNIEGYVVISFVIDPQGKVSNVRVVRPASPLLNDEALRVIRSMPDWQPGRQHGKPVSVEFSLPVRFRL